MKRVIRIIPIMIIVATIALWMLGKDYAVIDLTTRWLIALGAALFSGIISYFLFRPDQAKVDPFPGQEKK